MDQAGAEIALYFWLFKVGMRGCITAYKMGTQFSMVTHWKTVNMASPMLSKEVMPGMGEMIKI